MVFRIMFDDVLVADNMGGVVSHGLEPVFKVDILPKGEVEVEDDGRWGG